MGLGWSWGGVRFGGRVAMGLGRGRVGWGWGVG